MWAAHRERAGRGALNALREEEVVAYLGCPTESNRDAGNVVVDEFASVVGGKPALGHFGAPWPGEEALACSFCLQPLMFVAQVYAPVVENQVRTLYIFGCNAPQCTRRLESWRIFRCQRIMQASNGGTAGKLDKSSATEKSETSSSVFESPKEAWGESVELGLDDLEQLLNEKDANAKKKKKKKNKKKKAEHDGLVGQDPPMGESSTVKQAHAQGLGEKQSPLTLKSQGGLLLEVYEEPIEPLASTKADNHIEELLKRYNEEQAQLGEEQIPIAHNETANEEGGDETAEEDEERASSGNRNELEENDLVMDFKNRIEREPSQCLRYAYQSQPLSAVSPTILKSIWQTVPICETCGAQRAFELQLMPAVLWHLQEQQLSDVHGLEMDWSTVLIFSCSQSCQHGTCEYGIALAPL